MTAPGEPPDEVAAPGPVLRERTPEEQAAARARRAERRARRRARLRRRRARRVLTAVAVAVVVLALVAFAWVRWTFGGLDEVPGALPATPDTAGTTVLLVASDPGAHDGSTGGSSGGATWRQDLRHSDLVMLLHVPADRSGVYAVSLPGTTRLDLGGRRARLGQVAGGGGPAYVRAVEAATGVHVDHLAVLDLNGIREVADTLGGLDVQVPSSGCGQSAGEHTLDGQAALELMRLRPCLPEGDLGRVARQQAVFKAALAGLVDGGTVTHPLRLNRVAKGIYDHLAVESGWGLLDQAGLAWSLRATTPRTTTFLTAPTVRRDGALTLAPRAGELWSALRADRMAEYVALNRDTVS